MSDICTDNRFEVIEKYKQKLIEATNIEQSPKEMEVLDNILFRFWQMGWLKAEVDAEPVRHGKWVTNRIGMFECTNCKKMIFERSRLWSYCPMCGALMDGEEE